MPNYVKNILIVEGPSLHVNSMLESIKSEDDEFDFNKIFPMPKQLEGSRSPAQIVSQREYDKWERNYNPNAPFQIGRPLTKTMQKELIEECGFDNWYDWRIANWGTKWNSNSVQISEPSPGPGKNDISVTIIFETAWASPIPIITYLGNHFPTMSFELTYADEDCGYNVGEFTWEDGELKNMFQPDGGSNEAMEIFFKCWNQDKNGWEMIDGKWEFVDEW